jgi:hypothetical protein
VTPLWDTAPCNIAQVNRRFREDYCLRQQGGDILISLIMVSEAALGFRSPSTRVHGAVSQESVLFILVSMRTSMSSVLKVQISERIIVPESGLKCCITIKPLIQVTEFCTRTDRIKLIVIASCISTERALHWAQYIYKASFPFTVLYIVYPAVCSFDKGEPCHGIKNERKRECHSKGRHGITSLAGSGQLTGSVSR